jgi:hypothetical protein
MAESEVLPNGMVVTQAVISPIVLEAIAAKVPSRLRGGRIHFAEDEVHGTLKMLTISLEKSLYGDRLLADTTSVPYEVATWVEVKGTVVGRRKWWKPWDRHIHSYKQVAPVKVRGEVSVQRNAFAAFPDLDASQYPDHLGSVYRYERLDYPVASAETEQAGPPS